jgi:hypothetical protein
MNDRIKKLKELATSYTWNGDDVTEELDADKFAELLVRDAMLVTKDYTCTSAWDYSAPIVLAKHFGVTG